MLKNPLAMVCALAFVAGGVSAFVLEYTPRGAAGARGVADVGADARRGAAAADPEASEPRPEAPTRPEEVAASGDAHELSPQTSDDAHELSPQTDDASAGTPRAGVRREGAGKPSTGVRGRATFNGRGGEGRGAPRGHAKVSRGGDASGGRSIAGYTVGGVKKTGGGVKKAGAAIGKTFGKIGGVFHD